MNNKCVNNIQKMDKNLLNLKPISYDNIEFSNVHKCVMKIKKTFTILVTSQRK